MMQAYRTYCALSGKDTNFTNFITAYQNYETPDKRVQKAVDDYKRKVLSALDLDGADLSHIGNVKKKRIPLPLLMQRKTTPTVTS